MDRYTTMDNKNHLRLFIGFLKTLYKVRGVDYIEVKKALSKRLERAREKAGIVARPCFVCKFIIIR